MTAASTGRLAVGVDVGGSGIKVAVVDVERGTLAGPRLRVATPQPSSPGVVLPTMIRTVRRAVAEAKVAGGAVPEKPGGSPRSRTRTSR
ncbi:MAG TPA: hypothetical protein VHS36_01930, partial [Candidatus Limnocylindrales bacterium]|nr:hypothetical protein [Candidatus Limnocylindrales bacterium]